MGRLKEHNEMVKTINKLANENMFDSNGVMNILLEDIGLSLAVIADHITTCRKVEDNAHDIRRAKEQNL